jgi:hypothetical protein
VPRTGGGVVTQAAYDVSIRDVEASTTVVHALYQSCAACSVCDS